MLLGIVAKAGAARLEFCLCFGRMTGLTPQIFKVLGNGGGVGRFLEKHHSAFSSLIRGGAGGGGGGGGGG